jgi:hypothetical protein
LVTNKVKKYPPHNCREKDKLIKCYNGKDTWKCSICGREIIEICDFEEDYS